MNNKTTYIIDPEFHHLRYLTPLIEQFESYFIEELELEPFESFSPEISSAYWYAKYHLLLNNQILIDEDLKVIFSEPKINVIWFTITDRKTFSIKCLDGDKWQLNKLGSNKQFDDLIKNIRISPMASI
ncbi:hypothetical protein [Ulvibacter litoralis]|uniref:Uncharacterized protein n=1 Tax=Ulvibacter litoralis TaxID=227084 RepID=A0A1G7K199_9FLAO|nr:hypothetical protein [Ulvibacter litoralis]GHC66288.1 hypothetical protein GCM10008083_34090 [Ulvibacter litoralis]SDF30589.1 hypothetical protein SAMN05421855_1411 [Ulvibacter litoralis]